MGIYIYKHTNIANNKSYIGQTTNIKHRWSYNGLYYKSQKKFYNAILKYGWSNFTHDILCFVDTQEEADAKERYYIEYYKSIEKGYNVLPGTFKEGSKSKIVYMLDIDTLDVIKVYPSLNKAALDNNTAPSTLSRCCNLKNKSLFNHYWCFKDNYETFKDDLAEFCKKKIEIAKKNVSEGQKRGRGRPSVDRSNKLLIAFEATRPLKERLEEEAKLRSISLSALIREKLEKSYEER